MDVLAVAHLQADNAVPSPRSDEEKAADDLDGVVSRSELASLRDALEAEKAAREDALIAQEHRIIPAVRQLVWAFSDPKRKSQRASAAYALAWCLVPSGASVAGGGALIVALLTAALTVQQMRLMAGQNQRLDVQNALAEAQRRSDRLSELAPLLSQIASERSAIAPKSGDQFEPLCNAFAQLNRCWRPLVNAANPFPPSPLPARTHTYVPSDEVLGRITALTKLLRPYRALSDEPEETCRASLATKLNHPLKQVADGTSKRNPIETAVVKVYSARSNADLATDTSWARFTKTMRAWTHGALKWLSDRVQIADQRLIYLACSPISEERGQVLAALIAMGVDTLSLMRAGADFRFADLSGVRLNGEIIIGVDLSHAILRGADFSNAIVFGVNFTEADLRGVKLLRTSIVRSNFANALLPEQTFPLTDLSEIKEQIRSTKQNKLEGSVRTSRAEYHSDLFHELCQRLFVTSLGSAPRGALVEKKQQPEHWEYTIYYLPHDTNVPLLSTGATKLIWSGETPDGFELNVGVLGPSCFAER